MTSTLGEGTRMQMTRVASLLALGSAVLFGCGGGGVGYGDPTAPTSSQMQAVGNMTTIGGNVSTSVKGMGNADKPFEVYSLMATLQGAINQSSSQGLSIGTETLPDGCATGSAATGFTYTNCTTGSGTTLSGSVQITPTSVTYDMTVSSSVSSATTAISLKGSVSYSAGRITGNLTYKIHTEISGLGGLGGIGGTSADITTTADWDIAYTEEPSCITNGFIEVKVDSANGLHGAKFLFSGCNAVLVQNG